MRPSLAVRGLNCLLCHANLASNVITDFGYGTPGFNPTMNNPAPTFFSTQEAYNNQRNTWQTASITNGSVYIPKIQIPAAQADTMFGVAQDVTMKQIMEMPNLNGSPASMASVITPPAGQDAVIELSRIQISYPSQSEILALVPAAASSQSLYVGPAASPKASASSAVSGLAISSNGSFVRNGSGPVTCYGDIVVKGTLFLKNLNLVTDNNGCRIYASETVFIQGPILYASGPSTPNLQITSPRGILMGLSLPRMGDSGLPSPVRIASFLDNNLDPLDTKGGNFARFAQNSEAFYAPDADPVARAQFFDNLVLDGRKIGSELLDSYDSTLIGNPPPGSSVVGGRLSIQYKGLLLNAPHVHSRYDGSIQGVIVSDIAMFLLSSNTSNAHFTYDPIFSQVPILPALTTQILVTEPLH